MSTPVNLPELIISLSRDKVGLHLMEKPEIDRAVWQSSFAINGSFLEDQISNALDEALLQNPYLFDSFNHVEVVILDHPNVCIPCFYLDNGKLPEIAGKYLRLRVGDTLRTDTTSGDSVIAYCIPTNTIHVLDEYYAGAGNLHMTSVLWTSLVNKINFADGNHSKLFYLLMGNTLIILGEKNGKLSFSKIFHIRDQGDLYYFMIACNRMIRPKENWHISVMHEVPLFEMSQAPHFTFHHHLELPGLHTLIARHRACES